MSTPLTISFVVPIYKIRRIRDRFDALIQSLLAQTYPHTEIIFVNDASPDNSADILQDLAAQHSHIRILTHSRNQGQGPARNTGAAAATGDYIWFVDQDDLVAPHACQILTDEAQNHGSPDIVHFQVGNLMASKPEVFDPPQLVDYKDYHKNKRCRYSMHSILLNFYKSSGTPWKHAVKADLARASQFPDFYPEDIVHTLGMLARTNCILHINATLYCWRPHELSTSWQTEPRKNFEGHIKALQAMRKIAQDFSHREELSIFFLCHDSYWTMTSLTLAIHTDLTKPDFYRALDRICPNTWSAYSSLLRRYIVHRAYHLLCFLLTPPTNKRFPVPIYYIARMIQALLLVMKAIVVLPTIKICPWLFHKLARRYHWISNPYKW